jgi:uncharacterized protein YndB with AHSA1/START domain
MTPAATANAATAKSPTERELVLTRTFDAPRSLVFKAWVDVKHMAAWWGPRGFTNPICEMDVRPGGAIRIVMRAPADAPAAVRGDHPMTGTFHEIAEPERLVFTSAVDDPNGTRLLEMLNTVTFVERDGKTTLTLHARVVKSTPQAAVMLSGMEAGWSQSLVRLADLVARMRL